MQADFEGALKFFRVQLPKRYRAAENARRLMEQACNIKVRRVQHALTVPEADIVELVVQESPPCIPTNLD